MGILNFFKMFSTVEAERPNTSAEERIYDIEDSFKKEYRVAQYGDYYKVQYSKIDWGPGYYGNRIIWVDLMGGTYKDMQTALQEIKNQRMFDSEPIIHEVK